MNSAKNTQRKSANEQGENEREVQRRDEQRSQRNHADAEDQASNDSPTEQIAQLESQLDEARQKYQRALADLTNFQRRSVVNEREAREEGVAGVLQSLITVLDYFDLALKQDPQSVSAQTVMDGVELIRQELLKVFQEHGVSWIVPEPGEELQPWKHEAIGHLQDDEVEPGRIVRTEQHGCMLGSRVLRPAKVLVAPQPSDAQQDESEAPANSDAGSENQ